MLLQRIIHLQCEKICVNLLGQERRTLSMLNKEILAKVLDFENSKHKVEVSMVISVKENLITWYRLAIQNSECEKKVEGMNLLNVVSHCNKFTVERIRLSFECIEDVDVCKMFAIWMPLLMGDVVGQIKRTTFLGVLPNVPIIINFNDCSNHIDRQLDKLLLLLLGYGARDVILQNITLEEAAEISEFPGQSLTIECSDCYKTLPSNRCITLRRFVCAFLKSRKYKEINLLLKVTSYEDKIAHFVLGHVQYQTKIDPTYQENSSFLVTPNHKITLAFDRGILTTTIKTEESEKSEEEPPDFPEEVPAT